MRRRLYYVWITASIAGAAVFFFPWFLPRETISGLMGRWSVTERGLRARVALRTVPLIDAIFHRPFGMEDCVRIYELEEAARRALYVRGELT